MVLDDGIHVRMGRIEVAFWFMSERAADAPSPGGSSFDLPALVDTSAHLAGSTDSGPILHRFPDDPLYGRSVRLCQQLFAGQLQPPEEQPGLLGRMWSKLGGSESPDLALDRLQGQLARKPTRAAWLELARFFASREYVDLCRLVLRHLVKRYPDDEEVLVPLARACIQQGQDVSRPAKKRHEDYNSAEQCVDRALRLRPQDSYLTELKRQIAVERTILAGNLDREVRTKTEGG
jgi:hypothetical protein